MKVTATDVCRALRDDRSPQSGWLCDRWGNVDQPRRELWLAEAQLWVRVSGQHVTGWRGLEHITEWFGPISAFRIRRAVKAWADRLSSNPQPLGSAREATEGGQHKTNPEPGELS